MKTYNNYKNSNDTWLGSIPHQWVVSNLKHFVDIINGYAFKSEDYSDEGGVPIIRIGDISNSIDVSNAKRVTTKNLHELDRYIIKRGDLLLAMTGATIGKNAKYDSDDISYVNQRVGLLRGKGSLTQSFLRYYIESSLFREFISLASAGSAQENISASQVGSLRFALPQIDEQTKIAQYLDHQTAIIDQLILQKEKLIELLKEKRQAVINEAVTKGLNPNAKMKDSGIEWLGEVQDHWDIAKMKYGCHFILDGTHGSYERVDDGYRLLSVRNIIDSKFTFRDDDSRVSERDYLEISSKFRILENDIQLAIVGATLGKVAIVEKMDEPFVTQRSLATVRANTNNCIPKYLYYFLSSSSFQNYLWLSTSYSAQPGVYLGTIQKCPLPLPSLSEQDEIISHLVDRLSSYDSLTSCISQQIEKLKEYRQSIISEAVTGKIDVRDWQPDKNQVA